MQKTDVLNKTKEGMEKGIKGLNKAVNSIYFAVIIGILILAKAFLFYYHTIAIGEQLYSDTIIGTISFVVVIFPSSLFSGLPTRSSRPGYCCSIIAKSLSS